LGLDAFDPEGCVLDRIDLGGFAPDRFGADGTDID